ncbi:LPXTG cell wall anchor domain-containing protein [Enterococcus devriesei]|uniref:LPXTG cell wall anchor domain-containing protein n=1 Tax=Enterococcus devriesei TaxID=319970 RepID=UPI001C113BBE|nr:LPXTG cell wall anchor domain-containing protein [Enterococcus devriesei]MBU5364444.1 LPXTG cell wall anchor domain-containing protein [Enterococcus devriesei]MDT2820167.1 LPXTG cell wall anchor domain-containing protein [Enterococcus devriesei]
MTNKKVFVVALIALSAGLVLSQAVSAAETNDATGSSVPTTATTESSNPKLPQQDNIAAQLKAATEQYEARKQQIAQDLADAQQRREKRQQDLHNDFEEFQNQLSQNHADFQQHVSEVNDRLQTDHETIESTWSQAQTQLDQARADFNKKIADAKELQAQLQADQKTIDQNISQVKNSAQTLQKQAVAGSAAAKATGVDLENRANDVAGAVNRIKAVVDSAGDDLKTTDGASTQATEQPQVTKMATGSVETTQKQNVQTSGEYPKTNEAKNPALSLIGFGIVGVLGLLILRKPRG